MEEDTARCAVPSLSRAAGRRLAWVLVICLVASVSYLVSYFHCTQRCEGQPRPLEPQRDAAELQLNLTGPRQDPRLRWQADPALGRSFLRGPVLDDGQLRVHREGVYQLHVQVTLAKCSSRDIRHRNATLAVGLCYPAARSISLLRLGFGQACTVASQRLTPLARGDVLCVNLSLPLLPSPNADETFLGIQWVSS
ncbi:CD70 antigen [Heterocephalus glaber]|uniref:CD70 antigen n=1 Tax=Heterocephalus glaber TaxID=10181 RepID=A0AAX6RVU8_HETGA|nr:CD70 antigen [Heterocephalus glaber]